jgi:hypothetical protein
MEPILGSFEHHYEGMCKKLKVQRPISRSTVAFNILSLKKMKDTDNDGKLHHFIYSTHLHKDSEVFLFPCLFQIQCATERKPI